jgi:hypothetical protein
VRAHAVATSTVMIATVDDRPTQRIDLDTLSSGVPWIRGISETLQEGRRRAAMGERQAIGGRSAGWILYSN